MSGGICTRPMRTRCRGAARDPNLCPLPKPAESQVHRGTVEQVRMEGPEREGAHPDGCGPNHREADTSGPVGAVVLQLRGGQPGGRGLGGAGLDPAELVRQVAKRHCRAIRQPQLLFLPPQPIGVRPAHRLLHRPSVSIPSLVKLANRESPVRLCDPFSRDIFDRLDPILQEMYLLDTVPQVILDPAHGDDILAAFDELAGTQAALGDELAGCWLDLAVARGDFESPRRLDECTGHKLREVEGCEALLGGDWERAERCLAEALPGASQKGKRKSRIAVGASAGPCCICCCSVQTGIRRIAGPAPCRSSVRPPRAARTSTPQRWKPSPPRSPSGSHPRRPPPLRAG